MTDTRATSRLLEAIDEITRDLEVRLTGSGERASMSERLNRDALRTLTDAIAELRRRGDTLVRAEDLVAVLDAAAGGNIGTHQNAWPHGAAARLESALGEKP